MAGKNLREKAMQFLYQVQLQPQEIPAQLVAFRQSLEEAGYKAQDQRRILEDIEYVLAMEAELDAEIAVYLRKWSWDRISPVDKAILRLAFSEIRRGKIPYGVLASEAVQLADQFSAPNSKKFINGILGKRDPARAPKGEAQDLSRSTKEQAESSALQASEIPSPLSLEEAEQ